MKKKKQLFIIMMICSIFLVGCDSIFKKEVNTEVKINEVATIDKLQFTNSYVTFMPIACGKCITTVPQTHPAKYEVYIKYKGNVHRFNHKSLYEYLMKNKKVGDEIRCSTKFIYYDDDSIDIEFEEIENFDV